MNLYFQLEPRSNLFSIQPWTGSDEIPCFIYFKASLLVSILRSEESGPFFLPDSPEALLKYKYILPMNLFKTSFCLCFSAADNSPWGYSEHVRHDGPANTWNEKCQTDPQVGIDLFLSTLKFEEFFVIFTHSAGMEFSRHSLWGRSFGGCAVFNFFSHLQECEAWIWLTAQAVAKMTTCRKE